MVQRFLYKKKDQIKLFFFFYSSNGTVFYEGRNCFSMKKELGCHKIPTSHK